MSLEVKILFLFFLIPILEKVIPGAARACFFLQGQNCMAGTRLFVHQDIFKQVITGIKVMAESFKIGMDLIRQRLWSVNFGYPEKKSNVYIQAGIEREQN
ncbi:MAG: hypothetical protein Ct9H300mP4_10940 [Gammaproteobacteria bacterium]|nr:MAG: hypothetical protein Ct9H300mP4_10940 [Gammaproteobacteria bacterium]